MKAVRHNGPSAMMIAALPHCGRGYERAGVAELADAPDLGSGIARWEGSSPFASTIRTPKGELAASPAFSYSLVKRLAAR